MPFTKQTLDFLDENRLQNSRDWYAAHKPQYQKAVFEPLAELARSLAPAALFVDPLVVTEPKVDKTISRIYRDTRFSKDKSLYRDVMWCVFARDKREFPEYPALVFELSPRGFRYGCGYYAAPPKVMESARRLILAKDKSFQDAFEAYENQNVFTLQGELYKRPRFPDEPENVQSWLDRKGMAFMSDSRDFNLLFSHQLADTVSEGFRMIKPMYDFFLKARILAPEKARR